MEITRTDMGLAGFEKFTHKGKVFIPKIAIRSRGQFGFNAGAVNRFNIKKYQYVVMYYSKRDHKIAFRFTDDPNEEGAVPIVIKPSNFYCSGAAFLRYFGIPCDNSKSFVAEWDNENKIATIDL